MVIIHKEELRFKVGPIDELTKHDTLRYIARCDGVTFVDFDEEGVTLIVKGEKLNERKIKKKLNKFLDDGESGCLSCFSC